VYLLNACSINSKGEIVGFGIDSKGAPHGFLLTPSTGSNSLLGASRPSVESEASRKMRQQWIPRGKVGYPATQ